MWETYVGPLNISSLIFGRSRSNRHNATHRKNGGLDNSKYKGGTEIGGLEKKAG
jgi:hypothetical protein